jgi:hypothetical protein
MFDFFDEARSKSQYILRQFDRARPAVGMIGFTATPINLNFFFRKSSELIQQKRSCPSVAGFGIKQVTRQQHEINAFTDGEVKAALEGLPEHFRLPVLLADVEGFAYKEIAEMLDIPIGTVMSRLHRGRKAMQRELYEFAQAKGIVSVPGHIEDQ